MNIIQPSSSKSQYVSGNNLTKQTPFLAASLPLSVSRKSTPSRRPSTQLQPSARPGSLCLLLLKHQVPPQALSALDRAPCPAPSSLSASPAPSSASSHTKQTPASARPGASSSNNLQTRRQCTRTRHHAPSKQALPWSLCPVLGFGIFNLYELNSSHKLRIIQEFEPGIEIRQKKTAKSIAKSTPGAKGKETA